jgi:tetratricopeptide (TPR) repeat protein
MAEHARIDDLRRRVQKDPASIAFAQLAEEHRRAGQFEESVEVCRAGLAIHPTYLSARVTLGRALIELGKLDDARAELETVLKSAHENLAAIRGVAEICHKQGSLSEALTYYQAALAIARNDPELEQTVSDLSRQVAPPPRRAADSGLSLDDMRHELSVLRAEPPPAPPPALVATVAPEAAIAPPPPSAAPPALPVIAPPPPPPAPVPFVPAAAAAAPILISPEPPLVKPSAPPVNPALVRAHETIAVLEQWLDAIHGSRAL